MLVKKVIKEMNDLIEHHQLQVISLEEMLEEERQAARMNENAANHVIAELRKEISRYREALEYIADNKIEHGWNLKAVNCVVRARRALEESE